MTRGPRKLLFVFAFFAAWIVLPLRVWASEENAAKKVPIQHNGRVQPFDAFARQTLKNICGAERWENQNATPVLLEAINHRRTLGEKKWIRIDYFELKTALGLSRERHFFSLEELDGSLEKILSLVQSSKTKRDRDEKPSRLEQKAELLYGQIHTVQDLISGESLSVYPAPGASKIKIETEILYLNTKPFQAAALAYFLSFFLLTVFPAGGGSAFGGKRHAWPARGWSASGGKACNPQGFQRGSPPKADPPPAENPCLSARI